MSSLTFNELRPLLPFIVQQVGTMVQIKPYAGYYIWLDWFDLAPLDFSEAIDVLAGLIVDVNAIAVAAAADAATALADASNAQAAADAAQADATAALAGVAAIDTRLERFAVFGDEFLYLSGTPAQAVATTYPYNYFTFTSTLNAQAYINLHLMPGTWTFHILTAKRPDASKLTVTLNAVGLSTNFDLYAAVAVTTFVHVLTGITVSAASVHEILLLAAAKNASSSGHVLVVNKVWGERTGA